MFIVFEGPDRAGKTTQLELIHKKLLNEGFDVVITREPGGVELAEELRSIMQKIPLDPRTELLLMMAARLEHVRLKIAPALDEGKIVLCDRFTDSTYAYQGYAKGVPLQDIAAIEAIVNGPVPDVVVFFEHAYGGDAPRDKLEEGVDQGKIIAGFHARCSANWIVVKPDTQMATTEFIWKRLKSKLDCSEAQ